MLSHLLELRQRILIILCVFSGFFILFFLFSDELFHLLVKPLLAELPGKTPLIATQITSPVLIPIMLAANTAMLFTAPIVLLQLWHFIAPGLYQHERSPIKNMVISSLVLFLAGIVFCFYFILPFMFQFFTKTLPPGVKMMPDISSALHFTTYMLLLFGFCFQVPLICVALVRLQWIDITLLRQIRPYVIVTAFILGMLLTPPDVLSQIMLAVPLCLLYEIGILLATWKKGFTIKN